jgi:two-component system chemotaxis sensor kinase CheA
MSSGDDSPEGKGALQREFSAEAQELVEAFSRALFELEAGGREGPRRPDQINEAFRAMHTLKGLSSMLGRGDVGQLAHDLEEVLDGMRLGKVNPTGEVMDALFDAAEVLGQLALGAGAAEGESATAVEGIRQRVREVGRGRARLDRSLLQEAGLSAEVLQSLTEYEEHRLLENLSRGRPLVMVHGEFDLADIDGQLEALRVALKAQGEVISCLPSERVVADDHIGLDLLVAPATTAAEVTAVAAEHGATVESLVDPARLPASVEVTAAPVAVAPASSGEAALPRVAQQTVRVNIEKLDRLMNTAGELAGIKNALLEVGRELATGTVGPETPRRYQRTMRLLQRRLDELQHGILEVRMVPLAQVFEKLARVVRKLSQEAGKQISFYVSGGETELDKLIVEELADPLMHIIRNAIDHGIEDAETRRLAGKPAEGIVALRAFARGAHVVIEVEDDGAGIDPERLRTSAVESGFVLAEAATALTRRELLDLIFLPGFTTRKQAGALSGRGVGMDVVKVNLTRLSGIIDVFSEPGQGTRFALTLPITLAILRALIVELGGQQFAVPLSSVLEIFTVTPGDVTAIEDREVVTLREATLPLLRLEATFGLPRPAATGREYVVVVGLAQHRVGIAVRRLAGQQDIVLKSLGRSLSGLAGIAGATEVGEHRVLLVLDVAALVEEALHR